MKISSLCSCFCFVGHYDLILTSFTELASVFRFIPSYAGTVIPSSCATVAGKRVDSSVCPLLTLCEGLSRSSALRLLMST